MPTLLRAYGYRFQFFMADHGEPPHVHVSGHGRNAKVWLEGPTVAYARGFSRYELAKVTKLIVTHREEMLRAWYEHFER